MAHRLADFVSEASVTVGTDDFELAGVISLHNTFGSYLDDGDTTDYAASLVNEDGDLLEWEAGIGTYDETTNRLLRSVVTRSSNNNEKVSFGVGTKTIECTPIASEVLTRASGLLDFIINGYFAINQRGFAGGPLAAGDYGDDRMMAGLGGCTYSVAGTIVDGVRHGAIITHTSGQLLQVIESPGLAGATVTFSVEDLAGGDLAVDIEGETRLITAGPGIRGVTLTIPGTSTGNIVVAWEPDAGAVTYRRVQLNKGVQALSLDRRHIGQEIMLCQRYYQKTYDLGVAPGTINALSGSIQWPASGTSFQPAAQRPKMTRMRAHPATAYYSPTGGGVGIVRNLTADSNAVVNTIEVASEASWGFPILTSSPTAGHRLAFHAVSDAELQP